MRCSLVRLAGFTCPAEPRIVGATPTSHKPHSMHMLQVPVWLPPTCSDNTEYSFSIFPCNIVWELSCQSLDHLVMDLYLTPFYYDDFVCQEEDSFWLSQKSPVGFCFCCCCVLFWFFVFCILSEKDTHTNSTVAFYNERFVLHSPVLSYSVLLMQHTISNWNDLKIK